MESSQKSAWLIRLSGPPIKNLELSPGHGDLTLGRRLGCELCLPADAETVSRNHARFSHDAQGWHLSDASSRWGTFLNGYKLAAGERLPLRSGDLIRITPWTFCFSLHADRRDGRGAAILIEDQGFEQTMVRRIRPDSQGKLRDDLLTLLLEAAAGIHAAADEQSLASVVMEEARRGSGLANAAWLRPIDGEGAVEVVASVGTSTGGGEGAVFSRSLLLAASGGEVAELDGAQAISQSIVLNRIERALCVPMMLGQTIAAYLYLDSRGGAAGQLGEPSAIRPNASAFCLALGRIASLALSNLKRQEIEKRHAMIQADLNAGAEAQRWILPKRVGRFGPLSYIGQSRPGLHLGGDFFDLIPLNDGRLVVSLGDVTGKGVAASVLMTATQGFLHAALSLHGDPERAVADLCRFIYPRRAVSKFVTLWVGVFDPAKQTLTYVDAGHGHALLLRGDGTTEGLCNGGGLPIGVMETSDYQPVCVDFPPSARALIVSDGIIEQFAPSSEASPEQFGLERTADILRTGRGDVVHALFDAVIAHARTAQLADDATAVLIQYQFDNTPPAE